MPTKDIVQKLNLGGKGIPQAKSGKVISPKNEQTKDTITKLGSLARFRKAIGVEDDGDAAKKLARIAAIKKAALNNKKYNVGTSTAADPTVNPILYGGGGGGVMVTPEKPSFLSSVPSIVWIILAVGGGYFLIKSSGKGKLF